MAARYGPQDLLYQVLGEVTAADFGVVFAAEGLTSRGFGETFMALACMLTTSVKQHQRSRRLGILCILALGESLYRI